MMKNKEKLCKSDRDEIWFLPYRGTISTIDMAIPSFFWWKSDKICLFFRHERNGGDSNCSCYGWMHAKWENETLYALSPFFQWLPVATIGSHTGLFVNPATMIPLVPLNETPLDISVRKLEPQMQTYLYRIFCGEKLEPLPPELNHWPKKMLEKIENQDREMIDAQGKPMIEIDNITG